MPAAYRGAHHLAEKEEESESEAEFVPLKAKFHKVVPVKEKEESDDELLLTAKSSKKLEKDIKTVIYLNNIKKKHSKCTKYLLFCDKHPQYATYHIQLLPESESYVPNFIGGSLPCKDCGSREQYCMTMLTLFKPWRSGKDLKESLSQL